VARSFAFAAALAVAVAIAGGLLPSCRPPAAGPPAWLTPPVAGADASSSSPERRVVTIVALNDFHGSLYEQPRRGDDTRALGGLPWLVAAVEQLREEVPDLVLLDGGDLFQGSWPVNATRGMGGIEAFGLLGVDAAAIGNHEFDYGPGESDPHPLRGALHEAVRASDFQWLAANVFERDERGELQPWRPPGLLPWTIVERRGVRLGILGLVTTETPQTTLRRHVVDLVFDDVVETVRRVLPELEEAGADAVIVVGHLTGTCAEEGSTAVLTVDGACRETGEVARLLTELPPGAVDVIVAGHEHILIADRHGDTFVLEGMSHGRALNRLDLVFGPDGLDPDASVLHEPWVLEHDAVQPRCGEGDFPMAPLDVGGRLLSPSAEAVALVARLEEAAGSLCERVGCAARAVLRARDVEAPAGNLLADAILASVEGADVAIQNSGGIRADLSAGDVRREHLHGLMPFDNRVVVVELTGEALELLFRIGTSGAHGIPQVAGATYRYDPSVESGTDLDGDGAVADWERARLCWLRVGGEPVAREATYRVALNDFLYGGGDHFGPVLERTELVEEGPLVREALYDYVGGLAGCLAEDGPLVDEEAPRIEVGPCE
jgi:5'-nucleotidase